MGEKPATEIELTDLQDRWLNHNDQKAYQKMFEIIVQYSRSIILKMTRGKKYLNPDYVFNQAVDATIKFFEQYQKNPEFHIDYSFGGVLRYKVLECLYGPKLKKQDAITSLNSYVNNSEDMDELESLQEKLDMRPFWTSDETINDPIYKLYYSEESTIFSVMSVIKDIYKTDMEMNNLIYILISILLTFRKSKGLDAYKERYLNTTELKDIYEQSMLEIHDRLSEEV